MTTSNNFKTINVKVQRRELVDLLIACDACAQLNEKNGHGHKKWDDLGEKLREQLAKFDLNQ